MTDHAFAAELASLLNGNVDPEDCFEGSPVVRALPYDEVGVLTRNAGVVVRLRDGSEFQITVVRSR
jgi:hypothetical protein